MATSCSKKEGIDQDLSSLSTAASANLAKIFDISTDNSGNVKISPIGNGVSLFSVAFGHGTGANASLTPGGSTTHSYPEGSYTVSIVSKDIAGHETTNTYPLSLTYVAPASLAANISKNTNGVAVKPTALYAASFLVYFGDVASEVGTPCAKGAMVNHLYAAEGTYNVKVVAISGNATYIGAAKTEATAATTIGPFTSPAFAMPVTFDDAAVNYFFGSFGGGQAFTTVDNPSSTGLNTTASVGKFVRGWDNWSGTYSPLNLNMDFGTTKKIKLLAYNPDPLMIGLKLNVELESSLGGIPGNGVGVLKVPFTTSGVWEELVFDFSTVSLPANSKFGQIVLRFNDAYTGAGLGGQFATFYIDNIRLTN
jgi:hypothetical protein